MKTPELPVAAIQGYTSHGKKRLPYVSIWLDQLNCAQIHGPDRGVYANHLIRCVNERDELLKTLQIAVTTIAGALDMACGKNGDQESIDYFDEQLQIVKATLATAKKEHP